MKKEYNTPEILILTVQSADIITVSDLDLDDTAQDVFDDGLI